MTELMKRYEAETGGDAIILYEKHISDDFARWVNKEYLELQAENAKLIENNAQLNARIAELEQHLYKRMCNAFKESQEEVGRLERENTKLKAQLTWRPASEKPEKGQYFLANPSQTDRDLIIDACPRTYQFLGECSWEKFVQSRGIVRWLPIPPAPEGE